MLERCTVSLPGMAARLPPARALVCEYPEHSECNRWCSSSTPGAVGPAAAGLGAGEPRLPMPPGGHQDRRADSSVEARARPRPSGLGSQGRRRCRDHGAAARVDVGPHPRSLLPRSQSREEDSAAGTLGASDYVVKPATTGDLVARMRVWLRQQRRQGSQDRGAERLRVRPRKTALWSSTGVKST